MKHPKNHVTGLGGVAATALGWFDDASAGMHSMNLTWCVKADATGETATWACSGPKIR